MFNILAECGGVVIPNAVFNVVHYIILFIQIFIPIILIVLGMIDMSKAVISNDEKTMKESQSRLIKRVVYAVLVFLIVSLVKVVVGVVTSVNTGEDGAVSNDEIRECVNSFVNGVKTTSSGQ